MDPEAHAGESREMPPDLAAANRFASADVVTILKNQHWLASGAAAPEVESWCAEAARLLGPHAADAEAMTALLRLVFRYDAAGALALPENQAIVSREWARPVIRLLSHLILEGGPVDSDRFKAIITAMKEHLASRGRELFHPIRLALAGQAGEGELDRVILLLDAAAVLRFAAPVKGTRQRIVEFCAAVD